MISCTRRLEFDAAHRVLRHESKCRHLHGHRYRVELTCSAHALDDIGRIIDFGVIKEICGTWLDTYWDHGTILHQEDKELIELCRRNAWKVYVLPENPTAEVMAHHLLDLFTALLKSKQVTLLKVVVWETPNCWAEATP